MNTPISIKEISIDGASPKFSLPEAKQVPIVLAPAEKRPIAVHFNSTFPASGAGRLRIVATSQDGRKKTTKFVKLTADN